MNNKLCSVASALFTSGLRRDLCVSKAGDGLGIARKQAILQGEKEQDHLLWTLTQISVTNSSPPANSAAAIWSPSPPMHPQQPYPSVSLHSTSSYTRASISLHNVHTHTVASSPPFTQAANTPHPSSLPYLVALTAPDPIQFVNLVSVHVSILSNTSDPGLDRPLVQISRAATRHG